MQLLQNEAAEYLLTRAQKLWHVPVTSEPQVRGTPHPPAFPRPPRLGGRALFCASSANGLVRSLACHRFPISRVLIHAAWETALTLLLSSSGSRCRERKSSESQLQASVCRSRGCFTHLGSWQTF